MGWFNFQIRVKVIAFLVKVYTISFSLPTIDISEITEVAVGVRIFSLSERNVEFQ
jgi:hypothetical protein